MLSNWTKATTTTTGTGTITLSAVSGRPLPSAAHVVGEYVQYSINTSDGKFEAGLGTIGSSDTLARTTVFSTYNGSTYDDITASALSLASGTHTVFITPVASGLIAPLMLPVTGGSLSYTAVLSLNHGSGTTGVSLGYVGRVIYEPFVLETQGLLTAFQLKITSAVASSLLRVGLYETAGTGFPGRLIAQTSTTIDTSTTGIKSQAVGTNVRLKAGCYYVAMLQTAGASAISIEGCTGVNQSPFGILSSGLQPYGVSRDDTNSRTTLQDPFYTGSMVIYADTSNRPNIGLVLT